MGWRAWLACAALVLVGSLLLYGSGLSGGFVWDDFGYVTAFGSTFAGVGWLEALQWFWVERPEYGLQNYRPVLELSYVYQWRLFGFDPTGYRATNLLLHAGSSLLLAGVAYRLSRKRLAAAAAAVLFAVSPAHPEACLWLACRVNLLATFFMLGAVLAFAHGRRVWSVALAFLALGSKETAYVLPAVLMVWVFCEGGGPWRARVVESLRTTWIHWLVLAVYLALRYHAIDTLTGGYAWRETPDLLSPEYARERLDVLLVTGSPVNLTRSPELLRWLLLAFNGALVVAACGRPGSLRVVAWFVLAQVPIYDAPFSAATVSQLQGSRLLYEPTAPLVLLLAIGLARLPVSVGAIAASAVVALYAGVAWANAGPWLEVERASAAVRVAIARAVDEGAGERWIVDLPATHDGAFLYPTDDPVLVPPIHDEAARDCVHLRRTTQWRDVLARLDRSVAAGRADGFELRAARLRGRNRVEIAPEPIDPRWPLRVHEDLVVRVARAAAFDPRVDRAVVVDLLVEAQGAAEAEPLTVRLVDDAGRVAARYTRGAPEASGVRPLRVELPPPVGLRPGRYAVDLEVRGRSVQLVGLVLAPARGWP